LVFALRWRYLQRRIARMAATLLAVGAAERLLRPQRLPRAVPTLPLFGVAAALLRAEANLKFSAALLALTVLTVFKLRLAEDLLQTPPTEECPLLVIQTVTIFSVLVQSGTTELV
jgi:hypothetical protein